MTPIRTLLDQLSGPRPGAEGEDIVLGLPLESGDRTIYPVFVDPAPSENNGAEPKQIGYLEISEGRSDYTSLEPDNRPLIIMPVLMILFVFAFWMVRRGRAS